MSLRGANAKTYSLKNFRLCERLNQQLLDVAIGRIAGDIFKLLRASNDQEFIEARNRMDIPHGLFGLKLKDFYERRREDILYIDVLELVCQHTLQQAKTCIVLDDLLEFLRNLFTAYRIHNMEPIKQEIANSNKLLTINDTITEAYERNTILLQIVKDMLKNLYSNRKAHLRRLRNESHAEENRYMESILVVNKLEFRTQLNYSRRADDQLAHELSTVEEDLENTLQRLSWAHRNEEQVSVSSVFRQNIEINTLKKKLADMSLDYDEQMEYYEGEIAYHSNMIEIMRNRYKDCLERLPFFAEEMVKLREWEAEQERKKHEEARALIMEKPKKKKRKKKEDMKGATARRRK